MTSTRSGFDPALLAEASMGAQKMANMATKTNAVRVGTQGQSSGFPAQISSTDPEDEMRALQAKVIGPDGTSVPGVGISVVDPGFWGYAKRKMDAQEEAAYKSWVMQQIDYNDPANVAWWNERVPWVKQSREEYIDYVANVQKQAALIALNGPQNDDDLRFIFGVKNKTIQIPEKPLHQLNEQAVTETYESGFFSPFSQKIKAGPFPPMDSSRLPVDQQGFPWNNPLGNATTSISALPAQFFSTNANPLGAPR